MENEKLYDCIVIGAGQSGLAAGYHLQKAGQTFALLEAQAELTGSFGRYYDSLTLFSPVKHSQLPGFALKGLPGHYPTRLEFIQYLQDYRAHFNLPVKLSTAVQQVHKTPEGFSIITPSATFLSRTVINATGPFIEPNFPQYPGQEDFLGELMHSVDFRNGDNMEGKRILVVGAGNSAIQIAYELSAKAKVSIASRRKIKWVSQKILGRDLHFWLHTLGIDHIPIKKPPKGGIPVIDTVGYRKSIKAGEFDRKLIFDRFTEKGVVWQDGMEESIDLVIFATGFRPRFKWLSGLNVMDREGNILHRRGVSEIVSGLYFAGLFLQRNAASGNVRGAAFDAEYVVRRALHHLGVHSRSAAKDARQTAWRQLRRKLDQE